MCDYSLHVVASRPAEAAETLVSTEFAGTCTRGFAAPDNRLVAVCLMPGTEIAFEEDVRVWGFLFQKSIGARLARFRHLNMDRPDLHHDALEFSNGRIVMLTRLVTGQRAKILQLPAGPTRHPSFTEVRERVIAP